MRDSTNSWSGYQLLTIPLNSLTSSDANKRVQANGSWIQKTLRVGSLIPTPRYSAQAFLEPARL